MKKLCFILASWLMAGSLNGLAAADTDASNLCTSGKNQSPVNIDSTKATTIMNRLRMGLKFNYGKLIPEDIVNTGNGLRLHVGEGANIQIDGKTFALKYLDFHMPSENTVNKKHFPMEIEFYHEGDDKQPAAIVSMMVIPGKADRTLRKLLKQLPDKKGEAKPLAANTLKSLEMKKKLANYYRYSGSVTTAPCTEGVRWFILKQPLSLSDEQQQAFKAAIGKDNNRPVQPLNARQILE